MANQEKISILVSQQVPEFVREEHPRFIAFLEAYYEFLEQTGQVVDEMKTLKEISDVDASIDNFEKNFFNTYASLFPLDTQVSKELLIKNVLPFYTSKGSEKSFKYLFRSLFDEDVTITEPKLDVLRASDGKWVIETALRVENNVYSKYTGDGTKTTFHLAQTSDPQDIIVYINDTIQPSGFIVKKESRDIVFDSAPTNNSVIKILYSNFNFTLLNSRQIVGQLSGATAIVEKTGQKVIAEDNFFELYVEDKITIGDFINGETLNSSVIVDDIKVNLEIITLSDIQSIRIDDGGASYNVGDPVVIRGTSDRQAYAIVGRVSGGTIDALNVIDGGAGFIVGDNVEAIGYSTSVFSGTVNSIDSTGSNTPNTITVFTDVIGTFNGSIHAANTLLSDADYGFLKVGNQTISNTIASALTSNTFTIGGITSITITSSTINTNVAIPIFETDSPVVANNNPTVGSVVRLKELGVIGKVRINDGGSGYAIGDSLIFTNPLMEFTGRDATGYVQNVSVTGAITSVNVTGGMGYYDSTKWPTITVSSSGGSNANLTVASILGDGESYVAVTSNTNVGQILSIRILDGGAGYLDTPIIDLSQRGDGLARANAILQDSYVTFPGKWTSSDSILSSSDRKLSSGEYYNNYSYLLSSKVEFTKFKNLFKQLVHPAGFVDFAEYLIDRDITINLPVTSLVSLTGEVPGTVNIASGSINVTGMNTYFNVANSLGIISLGSTISINNEIFIISTIISNTSLTVTTSPSNSANFQSMIVVVDSSESFYISTETGFSSLLTENDDRLILE
jgi:hypothetical protein